MEPSSFARWFKETDVFEEQSVPCDVHGLQALPVPDSIRNLFKTAGDVNDDTTEHQGRIRSFPHARGNWATYILIPFTPDDNLVSLITNFQKSMCSKADVHLVEDFHISLSRTFTIPFHCIEPLTQSLKKQLQTVGKFALEFQSIGFYTNDEKTRSFLGLRVGFGEDVLKKLVKDVDSALKEFDLPKFYEEPSFHMSVCWTLGDMVDEFKRKSDTLQKEMERLLREDPDSLSYLVTEILCKTGNKVFTFNLESAS